MTTNSIEEASYRRTRRFVYAATLVAIVFVLALPLLL
jgi:hypothetical protein